MGQVLTIRQIDPRLHEALRERAARSGRSVEAEVRLILTETCLTPAKADWVAGLQERARARTGGRRQTDSADLIREARDAR